MEEIGIAFLSLLALALVIVPPILSIVNARRMRVLEAAMKKITDRIAVLERHEPGGPSPISEKTAPIKPPIPLPVWEALGQAPSPSKPPPLPVDLVQPSPPSVPPAPPRPATPAPVHPSIDWEAFMGVKLFAWIGGFVLFLGVVFLVKYSFENNLISPSLRIALGALIGLCLVAAGWRATKKNYRIPGQSLCATGVLVLYADVFAAHVFYQLIALGPAFAIMLGVTIAAFLLAVALDAQVVVILGLLGGFLTPILLSTGQDQPVALFGYIALLNAGIAAVVWRKRWNYLVLLSAIATALMEFDWAGQYGAAKGFAAMVIFAGFELQFLLIFFLLRKNDGQKKWPAWAATLSGFAALAFALWTLSLPHMAKSPNVLFGFVFAAEIGLLVLATARPRPGLLSSAAGLVVFVFFACWTAIYASSAFLWWALPAYILFAVLSTLGRARDENLKRYAPAVFAALAFFLVGILMDKLPMENPTPLFAVAFVLCVLLLAWGIITRTSWVAVVALFCTWAIEREWQTFHFSTLHAAVSLGWYLVFALLFIGYPFFASEKEKPWPWAVSAISGLLHFWLIFEVITVAYPAWRNRLPPAFFIVPYAIGVLYLVKNRGITPASGDAKLAWQGGAALFFVSLIFPIQFDREWITLGWALEGFALMLLFRKVPHRGLRIAGTVLLCLAFVRLALNPAVLTYHRRSAVPIWNWYLYAYGITSVCLILSARLWQRPRPNALERIAAPLLYSLGGILCFLLLNLEIADYFSIGPTSTFSFSGNFARDMTYSIAWAIFAFALLLIGMKGKAGAVRYAGLGLLLVTLAKLFLHDLGSLNQLYRIGAFIGVALILIVASFVYQRFLRPAPSR